MKYYWNSTNSEVSSSIVSKYHYCIMIERRQLNWWRTNFKIRTNYIPCAGGAISTAYLGRYLLSKVCTYLPRYLSSDPRPRYDRLEPGYGKTPRPVPSQKGIPSPTLLYKRSFGVRMWWLESLFGPPSELLEHIYSVHVLSPIQKICILRRTRRAHF